MSGCGMNANVCIDQLQGSGVGWMWWDRLWCAIAVDTVGTILESARQVRQASNQAGWQMTDSLTRQKITHIHCSIHQSMYAVQAPSMPHRYALPPLNEILKANPVLPVPSSQSHPCNLQTPHYMQPANDFTVYNASLVTQAQ